MLKAHGHVPQRSKKCRSPGLGALLVLAQRRLRPARYTSADNNRTVDIAFQELHQNLGSNTRQELKAHATTSGSLRYANPAAGGDFLPMEANPYPAKPVTIQLVGSVRTVAAVGANDDCGL